MAKYTRRFDHLEEAAHWIDHLRHFEGIRMTLKRVNREWALSFSHPQFRGRVWLNPEGVYLASDMVRSVYTRSGRCMAAQWEGVLTFQGEWIDTTQRSAA